jgi:hypothetical protein
MLVSVRTEQRRSGALKRAETSHSLCSEGSRRRSAKKSRRLDGAGFVRPLGGIV